MIDSVKLSQFAEELSNTPCPVCGKCHKVWFEKWGVPAGLEPLWFPTFEDGTCLGFQEFVSKRLNTL